MPFLSLTAGKRSFHYSSRCSCGAGRGSPTRKFVQFRWGIYFRPPYQNDASLFLVSFRERLLRKLRAQRVCLWNVVRRLWIFPYCTEKPKAYVTLFTHNASLKLQILLFCKFCFWLSCCLIDSVCWSNMNILQKFLPRMCFHKCFITLFSHICIVFFPLLLLAFSAFFSF